MGDESSKYRGIIFFLAFLSLHIFFYTFLIARHMLDKKIDRLLEGRVMRFVRMGMIVYAYVEIWNTTDIGR